jgi:hypothetical protein
MGEVPTLDGRHIYQFEQRPGGIHRMALRSLRRSGSPWQDADGTVMVIGRFLELVPDEQVVHLVASDDSIFADETMTNGK